MLGLLEHTGLGEHVPCNSEISEGQLWHERAQHNRSLLEGLRQDKHSQWLLDHACKEAKRGWNSMPFVASDSVVEDVCCAQGSQLSNPGLMAA